jgi:death on curing protein
VTPRWITKQALLLLHGMSLAEHGGSSGLRDEGLLDSALARPLNRFDYAKPDVPELAAAYGFGIAQNHPFIDGKKRAAFLAIGLFLFKNGWSLEVSQVEATRAILQLAAGEASEEDLAAWIRKNVVPKHASKRLP